MTADPPPFARALAAFVLIPFTLFAAACGGEPEPVLPGAGSPGDAALSFVLATGAEDPDALLRIADPDAVRRDDAGMRDATAILAEWSAPRALEETVLDEGRVTVDVEADLPGGGLARGSFLALRGPDGRFRIAAVFAPGIEWPRRESPAQEGLSVSPSPR